MSAPAKVLTNGTSPTLADWNFMSSVTGPDEVTFTAHDCSALTTYAKGTAVPGYSSMRIVDTRARLVPGSLYDITCHARGLISGSSRVISRSSSTDTVGWDLVRERRMELKSIPPPQFGQSHPNWPTMFYMSAGQEESLDIGDGTSLWVTRDRTYRGIASGPKIISRRITVNENISHGDSIIVTLPGGWGTPGRKSSVSLPRIVVEDTLITTTPPPTARIPGNYMPQFPPIVRVFSVADSLNPTWNWPNGWKLASINSEELLLNSGVYHQTLVYEYVWLKTL